MLSFLVVNFLSVKSASQPAIVENHVLFGTAELELAT